MRRNRAVGAPTAESQGYQRGLAWYRLAMLVASIFLAGGCGMMGMGHRGMMGQIEPRPPVTPMPTATPGGSATVSFRRDVSPILRQNCIRCHGGQVGLYLDSYESLMAGSSRTKVLIPGDPANSILLKRIRGELEPVMPLDAPPLPMREILIIETWVQEGAPNN